MKKFILLIVLFSGVLYSSESLVKSIEVNGLTKTKKSAFMRMIGVIEGDIWSEAAGREILRRLNNAGTFSSVALDQKKTAEGIALQFNVKEKWSIVGFPMIAGGGGSQYGAVVLDSNFMGRQSVAAAMAGVRNGKPQFFGFYSDPWFLSWRNYLTIIGGYSGEEVGKFERNIWVLGFEAGHRFTEYLSVGAGLKYVSYKHDQDKAIIPEDGKSYIFSLTGKYDGLDVVEDTFNGFMGQVTFQKNTWWSDFGYYKLFASGAWFTPVVGEHTLAVMAAGGVSDAPYGQGYLIGSRGGEGTVPVKGIDDNAYIASKVISGSVEYRVPVYKTKGFLFSMTGFYDFVHFSHEKGVELPEGNFINTMGVAFRVYVRKVTVPAFQIYAAYNPDTKNVKAGFSIGIGMGM